MGNISRTPMRDALGRLEQEGLITILPKKGLMVSPITDEDVHSIYEVRLLVEPYALRVYGELLPGKSWSTCHPDGAPRADARLLRSGTMNSTRC